MCFPKLVYFYFCTKWYNLQVIRSKRKIANKSHEMTSQIVAKLQKVDVYKCLGKMVLFKEGMEKYLKRRRKLVWKSFWEVKNMYKNKNP